MIRLLSKIFIPRRDETQDPAVRRAYGVLCSAVGIFLNLLLFAAKAVAGRVTGSIAMTADAFNNLSDAGSSLITLLGFRLAGQRPHREHPYGYGRYEYISGLIVSMAILLMGFDLARSSAEKIFRPEAVRFSWASAGILAASILVKLYMAFYNRAVGRKIHSVAVAAAAADSLSDACATAVVLASTLVYRFTGVNIDAWTGAAVSLLILWAGFGAAKDTVSPLLGKAPEPEFVRRVEEIVRSYPEVVGTHDLMVHDYGPGRVMISLHAEVPADGDIMALHDGIDAVERRLQNELNCVATIHMDPVRTDDTEVARSRERILACIRAELGDALSIHDFRMASGPTHTNVIFDVVAPYDYPMSDEELRAAVARLVEEAGEGYRAVLNIDHPVSESEAR